ncbi:hypothetical protein KIM372_07330 [Bombiscardovia nodaiensis]|uniref:Uncharacterized protein n=1 Tax=Bombiscardovia nodaiensis TaxID=2932181 RepID=A0ABN6S9H8_9BIFI|nr:hypothetical protein KIM372_07330 [Bombiscardovia nodaiensis]
MSELTQKQLTELEELDRKVTAGEVKGSGHPNRRPGGGARYLMQATGTATVEEAQRIALGRPRVGEEKHGRSPVVRFVAPPALKEGVERQARQRGIKPSEMWRQIAEQFLAAQKV